MEKDQSKNDGVRSAYRTTTSSRPEDPVAEQVERRVAGWQAKCTPERVSAIVAAKAGRMLERYRLQAEMQVRVDDCVAGVTDAAGLPVMMRIWYKTFGRGVSRIRRTVPSSCRELEYDVLRYKWTARGLEPTLLARVKGAVIRLLEESNQV
jgi:hypothetical protein